jgi:hypothetical protein
VGLDRRYLGYGRRVVGVCSAVVVQRADGEERKEDAVDRKLGTHDALLFVIGRVLRRTITPFAMRGMYIMELLKSDDQKLFQIKSRFAASIFGTDYHYAVSQN